MPIFVDANKIYDALEQRYKFSKGIMHQCERELIDLICELDMVDAVEVVRCKDCKHYNWFRLECHNGHMNGVIGIDGFCSYGERIEAK